MEYKLKKIINEHMMLKGLKKLFVKYRVISIISISFVIVFISSLLFFIGFSILPVIVTFLTVLSNLIINLIKQLNEDEKIDIYFVVENNKYLLDLDMLRKQISRSEILGILSVFQKSQKERYSIKYLSDIEFLDSIYKIQKVQINKLEIELTKDEFECFNAEKMKKI